MSAPTLRDRFRGAIVGLAVGDALGAPGEFRSRAAMIESFGAEGVTDFVSTNDPRWPKHPAIIARPYPPGTFTDDTQMSIAVGRALLRAGHAPLDEVMSAMAREFVLWSRREDNDRFPGETCMTGCRALEDGTPWREAGVAESKGAGSAMRVAPSASSTTATPIGCSKSLALAVCSPMAMTLRTARGAGRRGHGTGTHVRGIAQRVHRSVLRLRRGDFAPARSPRSSTGGGADREQPR